jgi:hypothetical protein
MCQETARMQDFAPFTLQLLAALLAHRPKLFSLASLAVLHLLFQNSLLLLKVLKALMTRSIFLKRITVGSQQHLNEFDYKNEISTTQKYGIS